MVTKLINQDNVCTPFSARSPPATRWPPRRWRSSAKSADDHAVVDQPEGDAGRRLHLPRLLHRPVPGRGDGQVRRQHSEAPSVAILATSRPTTPSGSPKYFRRSSRSSAARSSTRQSYTQGDATSRRSSRPSAPRNPEVDLRPRLLHRGRRHRRQARELGIEGAAARRRRLGRAAAVRTGRRGAQRLLHLEPLLGRRPDPGRPEVRHRLQARSTAASRPTPSPRSPTTPMKVLADAIKRAGVDRRPKLRDAIARPRTSPASPARSRSTRTATR